MRYTPALLLGLAIFGCQSEMEPARVSYAEQFGKATSVLITLNDPSGKQVQLEAEPEWAVRIGEVLDKWAENPPTCNCDTSWLGTRAIIELRGAHAADLHLGFYDSAYIAVVAPGEDPEFGLNFHDHAALDVVLFAKLPRDLRQRPELFNNLPPRLRGG